MSIILLVINILIEIFQVMTEGKDYFFSLEKDYFFSFENIIDLTVYVLVTICQFYYFGTGKVVNGYYFSDDDSYFQGFLFFTILTLHLNLILQYTIAFSVTRRYVIMIIQTFKDTIPFYIILVTCVLSYSIFLMSTEDAEPLIVFKLTYTLTLGELDFEELSTSRFIVFVAYTTLITLILMNLLIAILSDAYELVQSEKKYYEGKAKLERSLMFERLVIFFMELFKGEKE